jgi:hypothetical protein
LDQGLNMELEDLAEKERMECEKLVQSLDVAYEFTQLEGEGEIGEILADVN